MAINFIAGGRLGDFIHSLYVAKNICKIRNEKANIFLQDSGDVWTYGINTAYADLKPLMARQSYVERFEIAPTDLNQPLINLNDWRSTVSKVHAETGTYSQCWSEVLSNVYEFPIAKPYSWMDADLNIQAKDKICVHRSVRHHNGSFPWHSILKKINHDVIFVTSKHEEWESFPCKYSNLTPHFVSTIDEMASTINSCKLFIGNQSAPFAIASALDVPRLVELDSDPSRFYMDEVKYSDNISWYLNESQSFLTPLANQFL
jgi:hypothetical protein